MNHDDPPARGLSMPCHATMLCHPVFTVCPHNGFGLSLTSHQGRLLGVAMIHEPPMINMHVTMSASLSL